MLLLIFRTILIYLLTILAMRLMGKKQLGELQPSELVSAIMISNLASISIESPEMPLLSSIMPVFVIVSAEILLSALCVRSHKIAHLVAGGPRVIIRNGVIDQQAMQDLRFTADDLLEALHGKDIFEISDVSFAMVETNGSLSVMKTFSKDMPCNGFFHFKGSGATVPSLQLVTDGEVNYANLKICGVTEAWIEQRCAEQNIDKKDVLLMLCNDTGDFSIIKKESR